MIFRKNTNDAQIWDSVTKQNEYNLPLQFTTDDLILDIGAHTGSFSYEVLRRGAGNVWAFEADHENFRLAAFNLQVFRPKVKLEWAAVCRSDIPPSKLYFGGYERLSDRWNTGGGSVLWETQGQAVPCRSFDEILLSASENLGRPIRLVKFDCEESEWPIIFTSQHLNVIEEIVGEFHEIGGLIDRRQIPPSARVEGYERFTSYELSDFLSMMGFTVQISGPTFLNLGKFYARNQELMKRAHR